MQINTVPKMHPPHTRFVQAMVVAGTNVPETSGDHALFVYNIPHSERAAVVRWLQRPLAADATADATADASTLHAAKQRLLTRMRATGFTPHDKHTVLAAIADAYRAECNPASRIGWARVPMVPGSVVLFGGIHRVAGGKAKRAQGTYRTVLYLNPWTGTTATRLPETVATEVLGDPMQRNTHQGIEPALCELYRSRGWSYGINEETVPEEARGLYVDPTDIPPTFRDTPTLQALRENGFVVLRDCLTPEQAHELHEHIVDLTRDTLFGIARPGQSEVVRAKAMGLSLDTFAQTLYSDQDFRNARYFDGQTTAQWVPDDDVTTPPDVREQRERKRRNTRGVRGLTNSSGMVDVYQHPAFIKVHRAIHRRLMAELGLSKLFFGPERCGLRAYLSAELPPHQDEPLVVGDVRSEVVAGGEGAGGGGAEPPAKRARVAGGAAF